MGILRCAVRWRRKTRTDHIARLIVAGTVAGVVCSCGDSSANDALVVDTLASGRVVVSNPDPSTSTTTDTFRMVEDLRIGAVVGDGIQDPFVFGAIVSSAVDELGNIYVADAQWREIRVFDPEGDFLHSIGGPGEGPGEFRSLAGAIWTQANGILLALDPLSRKITAFDRYGQILDDHTYGRYSRNAETVWQVHTDASGHVYQRDPDSAWRYLLRYGTTKLGGFFASDSLLLPEVEVRWYSREYDFGTASSPVPMAPQLHWTVALNGGIWLARSDTFRIHNVALSGDIIRTVELRRAAQPLQGRHRDSVATAAGLSSSLLPRYKPVLGAIAVAPDSWLWISVTEGNRLQAWDLFDDAGRYRGQIAPPEPLVLVPPPLIADGTVVGVVEDELGGQSVVRYRVLPAGVQQ